MSNLRFPQALSLHQDEVRKIDTVTQREERWIPLDDECDFRSWRRFTLQKDAKCGEQEKMLVLPVRFQDAIADIRSGLKKLFGKGYKGETFVELYAPIGKNGADKVVRTVMPRARNALVVWARVTGIDMDEEFVQEMFPDNCGIEVFGADGEVALVMTERYKTEEEIEEEEIAMYSEKKKHRYPKRVVPAEAPPSRVFSDFEREHWEEIQKVLGIGARLPLTDAAQEYLRRVINQFSHEFSICDIDENVITSHECLRNTEMEQTIAAFQEAEKRGISTTTLYLPEKPDGLVSLVLQAHDHPFEDTIEEFKDMADVAEIKADLFLLYNILRTHNPNVYLLLEGMPYKEDKPPHLSVGIDGSYKIPGTYLQVLSPAGQEHLVNDRESLCRVFKEIKVSELDNHPFTPAHLLDDEMFPNARGAEPPNFDNLLNRYKLAALEKIRQLQIFCGKIGIVLPTSLAVDKSLVQSDGDYEIEAVDIYKLSQVSIASIEERGRITCERESFVENNLLRISSKKKCIPHLTYGAQHMYSFLDRFFHRNVGVLLTKPCSLRKDKDVKEHLSDMVDSRNADYIDCIEKVALLTHFVDPQDR